MGYCSLFYFQFFSYSLKNFFFGGFETNTISYFLYCIGITASSATFKSCHFENNRAVSGGAIAMTSLYVAVVDDNDVDDTDVVVVV